MDIAVLADIHSNYIALERCFTYALSRNITTFIFLGDYIGELAYPQKTMRLFHDMHDQYTCYSIKGNKEEYWLQYRARGEKGWKNRDSTTGSLLYAYNSLSSKDLLFFAQLKPAREIIVGEMAPITICHGSPYKINESMVPDDDRTIEIMNSVNTSIILCGHSHIQRKIVHNDTCVLNPGAVGVPLFSKGKTQFLILHDNDGVWAEEWISLEYDVDATIRDMQEAGLYEQAPYWSRITEHLLRGGNIPHYTFLSRAMELCREDNGECVWPDISEKYWAQAFDDVTG